MSAKELHLAPISATLANATVRRLHYSGKVVNNSQVHIGVFWNGKLEGAMQFGPSLSKRKLIGLVEGTGWNEFIELNRMAFSEALPRNSESRAIAVAMRLLKAHAPHLKWVVSFADGAQCGDGTIYRAAGFVLTGVVPATEIVRLPTGEVIHRVTWCDKSSMIAKGLAEKLGGKCASTARVCEVTGWTRLQGHQLRYLYFLDPTARARLTVPILPFSEIDRLGAAMYRGKPRVSRLDSEATGTTGEGRCDATDTLQSSEGRH